jgi:protein-S-isoprenylcysteine O-methyltransferase Ste14
MKGLELRIPPAAVAILLVMAMWGINQVTPSIAISWPIRIAVVVLMLVVSISILLLSIREFSKAKTTLTPLEPERASALLQSGVFAFTRNPIYLAQLICLIAFAVILFLSNRVSNKARGAGAQRVFWRGIFSISKSCASLVVKRISTLLILN